LFENLSPKGKRIVLNGIIVSAIMLFIIGFLIGKSNEKKEEVEDENTEEMDTETGLSYSDLHRSTDDNEEQVNSETELEDDQPMDEHYEHDNPEIDFDINAEREINILEDYFSKEEIDKAKEVSESFIKALYTFNGDTPTKHINEATKFVTEALSDEIKGKIIRPTHNYYSRKLTDIFVYEPYNPTKEEMNIRVRVEGKVFNSNGDETKTEILDYDLILTSFEDTFKINDYSFISYR
jgi:hypothetical protein